MSEPKEKPGYFAIIPASVRYDERLSPNQKLLYAEITALANKKGFCHASNSYFAGLYGVHKDTAGKWVNALEKAGYISSVIKTESGKFLERRLYIVTHTPPPPHDEKSEGVSTKRARGYRRKERGGIDEKSEVNNTRDNITRENSNTEERDPLTLDWVNNESDQEAKEKKGGKYSDSFLRWWELYPKKVGKGAAFKVWKREKLEEREGELIEKLKEQIEKQYQHTEPRYIPNASTYLNQSRYDDEVINNERNERNYASINPMQRYEQEWRDAVREQEESGDEWKGRF